MLDVFCAGLEAFLAVFAGLDQVIEYGDRFFVDISHFSIPSRVKKRVLVIAAPVPAFEKRINSYISTSYRLPENLYPLYLHDLSFGLHAECLYFPRHRLKHLKPQ
jgi:hypothetical protein